ncbi:claw keratin-like isoform X2 [Mauremys mutica]|uniref:claw keratin-like isoform X2 n=1 Tax=Mauremys mutica TaxID=74926 RepID=UPI001D13ED2C|nr:claw keratin-like isoform X2 [Mauremys mutica]
MALQILQEVLPTVYKWSQLRALLNTSPDFISSVNWVYLHPRKMTFSSLCYPECGVARPSPVTGSFNEPCVRQCPDSEVVIRPSPVVVTLPGPILSNFPQQSKVAAVGAPVVGAGFGGSFGLGGLYGYGGHYGGLYGLGRLGGYGGLYGYGGLLGDGGYCGYPGIYGYGGLWGYGGYGRRYLGGYCGPC